MTTVVHLRKQAFDVRIDRGTVWGNPFVIGRDGDRTEVIRKYRTYITERLKKEPALRTALLALEGQRLGCHCAPLACHGDVLVELMPWVKVLQEHQA